jgi:hypothetical protein
MEEGIGDKDIDKGKIQPSLLTPEGFLLNLIELGVDAKEISAIAEKLTKEIKPSTRVTNRYLPQSLLVQALSDPATAILDPQLQDFLKGVKIKIPVADVSHSEANDLINIFKTKDNDYVKSSSNTPNDFVIDIKKLMNDAYGAEGVDLDQLLLEHHTDSNGNGSLYMVSGISGADLYRARFLQLFLKSAKAYLPIHSKMPWARANLAAFLKNIPSILTKLQSSQAKLMNSTSFIYQLFGVSLYAPQGFLTGTRAFGRLIQNYPEINQAIDKFVEHPTTKWISNNTKNGNLMLALTAVFVASRLSVAVIDSSKSKDEIEKAEILTQAGSDSAAMLTYLLPYVGWPSILVDVAHDIGWLKFKTADAYNFLENSIVNGLFAIKHDKTIDQMNIESLELKWNFLYNEEKHRYLQQKIVKNPENSNQLRLEIMNELQNLSLREILFNYEAHQIYFKKRNNFFGQSQEYYHLDFLKSRNAFKTYLDQLTLNEFSSHQAQELRQ